MSATAAELWLAGERDTSVIAATLGVSARTVLRHLDRAQVDRPRRAREGASPRRARALKLLAEGMPATWVSEDTGLSYNIVRTLGRTIANRDELVREWKIAWQQIRKNEELLMLHWSVAPPSYRSLQLAA